MLFQRSLGEIQHHCKGVPSPMTSPSASVPSPASPTVLPAPILPASSSEVSMSSPNSLTMASKLVNRSSGEREANPRNRACTKSGRVVRSSFHLCRPQAIQQPFSPVSCSPRAESSRSAAWLTEPSPSVKRQVDRPTGDEGGTVAVKQVVT